MTRSPRRRALLTGGECPTRRRRCLPGAAAIALLLAFATVGVQAAGVQAGAAAKPVIGGGSFADAPLLEQGLYTDTLLPRETLFYAVALSAGQRPRVRATIDSSVGSHDEQGFADALSGFPVLTLFTPLHQSLPTPVDPENGNVESESAEVDVVSPRVLSAGAADRGAEKNAYWVGPGVYHLAIVLSEVTSDLGATVELPLGLAVEIDGRSDRAGSTVRPSPGPLGDARDAPVADDRGESSRATAAAASLDTALVIGGGTAALLLGASAGYLAAVRRARA